MGLKKRLGAFLLCGVIAFHSVCFYTPPAKAVIVESALASAAISTYLSATGFQFFGGGSSNTAMNEAIHGELCELTKEFAESIDQLNDEVTTVITSGVTWAENGIVKISAAAANMMGRFSDWLIEKFGLIGEDGVPVTDPVSVFSIPRGFYTLDGNMLGANKGAYSVGQAYSLANGNTFIYSAELGGFGVYTLDGEFEVILADTSTTSGTYYFSYTNYDPSAVVKLLYNKPGSSKGYDNMYTLSSSKVMLLYHDVAKDLSVSLAPDYEAAPDVDEQYAMVIDTGLTFEDEQSYIDAVLNGVAAGTLSPTYTIEETTTGDVTVPDEGEDTDDEQVGILDWTKKIWQSVKELPGDLMDALTNVFVPSAEYTAALPQMVVDTFDSRTGFLTYPFSVLADFIGRLGDAGDDWIITWPDIDEPFSGGRLISKGEFNVSEFVRSDLMLSNVYSLWMLITKGYLIFLFLELCHRKYKSVVGDRLE